jgi:hypothetical protein
MVLRIKSVLKKLCAGKPLLICLVASVVLCLPGIQWGIHECWNLDQMGHLKLRKDYMPAHYLKPPMHTYLNHLLVLGPAKQVLGGWFHIPREFHWPVYLIGSRLLTLALFCGFLIFIHRSIRSTAGADAAFAITLALATSSGILVFNRYLTADSPLLFWMTASFAFAVRAGMRSSTPDAVIAGLLAGLAAANKYNGLGVAAAIPAALIASQGWRFILKPTPWLAGLAVPTGFLLGNPGAVLDSRRFLQDFFYNYLTTPVYDGQTEGTGYFKFLACFPELIGWPSTLLLSLLLAASLAIAVRGRFSKQEWILTGAALAVFSLYFAMIGKFPRMGTRFVLPAIPFALVLAAPALARIDWKRSTPKILLGLVIAYNAYSSLDAGLRFLGDPRMHSIPWVAKNLPAEAIIENSYAPSWQRIPGRNYRVQQMPAATGRTELFSKILANKKTVQTGLDRFESHYDESIFNAEGLSQRNPDFIAFTTQVFDWSGDDDVQRFYAALDREELGYKKLYERKARGRWPSAYPCDIGFLPERMVILGRLEQTP